MDQQETMKAVVATGYGPPEQYAVAEVPVPHPARADARCGSPPRASTR